MNEFNQIPASISHKELNSFLNNAYKEIIGKELEKNNEQEEQEQFHRLSEEWLDLSKEILINIEKKKKHFIKGKEASPIMALGAMEVHLNMAIQALIASGKEKK